MTEPLTAAADGVRILHRDAELLVLYKPSGLPTTSPDGKNCLTAVASELDPSAPRLHASSRLDAEVTGAVTFARTTRAIEALLAARRAGAYERFYLALASVRVDPAEGRWQWPIDLDPRDPRKRIARVGKASDKAREAASLYRVVAALPMASLMLLQPLTGRTHQLRVHAAQAGAPLLGDRHYGGPMQRTREDGRVLRAGRVMLHCARVRLPRIAGVASGDAEKLCIDAPIADDFRDLWLKLGGDVGQIEGALVEPSAQSDQS
jgi:23S rRNA-/tRNA-specific pseudouridylate synthase